MHADRQALQIKAGVLTRNHLRPSDCNVRRTGAIDRSILSILRGQPRYAELDDLHAVARHW